MKSAPPEVKIPRDATLVYAAGVYAVGGMGIGLARINDLNDSKAGPRDPCTRQILFREG
jgi:hypothetical protein